MTERSIFLAALEREDPVERAAYLDQACAGNSELRQQVEALLEEHAAAGDFLEGPAVPVRTVPDPTRVGPDGRNRVGPYKLLQQIGEGGFGMVWMAEQEQPVRRRVALKIIKPGMDSAQVIARFEAERQALAMMDHQNIARVFDAGTTEAGRPYFVMELVHGIPITKYCDDNHLSPRERIELFIPVCQAIQHAHQKGIIHRDVKPSNVLITLYDGKAVPKVIDFGVAKAIEQRLTDRTMFTQYGTIVGTFEYMAPEQAEMSALGVDTRSDIYSLGVVLYELLTGTTPLERQKVKEAAYSEVVRMIREDDPPRPSARLSTSATLPAIAAARRTEPTQLPSLIRGELDWIVMKCLEKDRARRYETANGLVRDLQRYLNDEPVEACPPSTLYRFQKLGRRYMKAFLIAVAFLLLLVVGSVVSALLAVRARLAEAEARRERDAAARALAQAEAVSRFLTEDMLGKAAPEQNPREAKVTAEELLLRAARRIDNHPQLAEQPAVEATLRLVIGNTLYKLGESAAAEPHLRRAVVLRRKVFGPEGPETLTAQEDLVFFLLSEGLGDLGENSALARTTWEARRTVLGPNDPATLDSMDTYCGSLTRLGRHAEAAELRRQCLEARQEVLGESHRQTLQSMNNLGWDLMEQGEQARAAEVLEKCLQRSINALGPRHPDTLPTRNNLALTLMELGRFPDAEATLREALTISREATGPRSWQTLYLQHVLTRILSGAGRWEEAERLGRETLGGRRETLPAGNPNIGVSLVVLGLVLLAEGKFDEADPVLREALEVLRGKSGQDQWIAQAEVGRGITLTAQGQFAQAGPLLAGWPRVVSHRRVPDWQKRRLAEAAMKVFERAGKTQEAATWRARAASARE